MTTPEQRADAARLALDILRYLDDCSADDILIVADWLLTGRCDVAITMAEQRARSFATSDGPDAARWLAPELLEAPEAEADEPCGQPIRACWKCWMHAGDCQC